MPAVPPFQPTPPSASAFPPTFRSSLPLVFLFYDGDGNHLHEKSKVQLYVIDNPSGPNSLSDLATATPLDAQVHIRGATTGAGPKFQYSVTLDPPSTSQPDRANFLGMPEGGEHWVFNAPGVVDFSYCRNPMAFHLQRQAGVALKTAGMTEDASRYWAPRTKYFELFICTPAVLGTLTTAKAVANAHACYQGLYILMEKIHPLASRVDIATYSDTHPTPPRVGDFILQLNHSDGKYVSLNPAAFPAPVPENAAALPDPPVLPRLGVGQVELYEPGDSYFDWSPTDGQKAPPVAMPQQLYDLYHWWCDWAGQFVMPPTSHGLPVPAPGYADTTQVHVDGQSMALIDAVALNTDLTSLATYLLLAELAKDPDGYHRSTFMVHKGGKAYAGPFWDKNKSYGNQQGGIESWYTTWTGWTITESPNPGQAPGWWWVLLSSTVFAAEVKAVWKALSGAGLPLNYITIETHLAGKNGTGTGGLAGLLADSGAVARDLGVWNNGYDKSDWLDWITLDLLPYLKHRLAWIDANLPGWLASTSGLPVTPPAP